jgi:hypothetical protein
MTVTVDVIEQEALNLLQSMERLKLIHVNPSFDSVVDGGEKSLDRFAGSLRLSHEQYQTYQDALKKSRDEWMRDIC